MPRFFFHIHDGKTLWLDDTGTEFVDLELAYLDAFRAADEMCQEMTREGRDASAHCFEVTDSSGRHLLDLPFSETFLGIRRKPVRFVLPSLPHAIANVARSRVLAVEITNYLAIARTTIENTQMLLRRSRALP